MKKYRVMWEEVVEYEVEVESDTPITMKTWDWYERVDATEACTDVIERNLKSVEEV